MLLPAESSFLKQAIVTLQGLVADTVVLVNMVYDLIQCPVSSVQCLAGLAR
jgi:hypothetical protein